MSTYESGDFEAAKLSPARRPRIRFLAFLAAACLALAVGALAAVPSLASAGQLHASDPPNVTGPLTLYNPLSGCDRSKTKFGSTVTSVTRSCQFLYRLAPGTENDPTHDYGILWQQATIAPRNGWCVDRAVAKIQSTYRGVGHAPRRRKRTSRTKRLRVHLGAHADGHATAPAGLSQHYLLVPKVLKPNYSTSPGNWDLTVHWRGSDGRRKLGFVGGIEIRWPQGPPPVMGIGSYAFASKLDFPLSGHC